MFNVKKSLQTGLLYLRRNRFLTATCLFVMTVSFLVTLSFAFSFVATNSFFKMLSAKAQITVFFKTNTPEATLLDFKSQLEKVASVESVNYVSQAEALKIYLGQHQNNPALLELVSSNILPASLEIKTRDLASLSNLASELRQSPDVDEVVFFKDVVENFRRLTLIFQILGLSLAGLMVLISMLVVLLAVGISVKIRADEMEIRRLVGASDAQVAWPFLWQGISYGLISSWLSLIIFSLVFLLLRPYLLSFYQEMNLPPLSSNFFSSDYYTYYLVIFLHLLFGPVLGLVSSLMGVKKYLRL